MDNFIVLEPIPVTDASFVSSTIGESEKAEWEEFTSYDTDDEVQVTVNDIHRIYRSQVDGNTGKYPPDYLSDGDDTVTPAVPASWKDVSATNRHKMFDLKSRAASVDDDEISASIAMGVRVGSLVLLNLVCSAVNVTMTDPTYGEVFNEDVSLADLTGINSFSAWCFKAMPRKTTVFLTGLPMYPDATITVTATYAGNQVVIGEMIPGNTVTIGTLENGTSFSFDDFTDVTRDEDGNATIDEGDYADVNDYSVKIESHRVDYIKRLLSSYRATPLVWADPSFNETVIYGLRQSSSVVTDDGMFASVNFEISEFN